jgi:hypothetical protein
MREFARAKPGDARRPHNPLSSRSLRRPVAISAIAAGASTGPLRRFDLSAQPEYHHAAPPMEFQARPGQSGEYLYGHTWGGEDYDGRPCRFRIVKRTAKRIFYITKEEDIDEHGNLIDYSDIVVDTTPETIGYVDRQKLEADGEVRNYSHGWWAPDFHLLCLSTVYCTAIPATTSKSTGRILPD